MESQFGRTARIRFLRPGGSGEIAQSVVGVGNKKRNAFPERGKHCVHGTAWGSYYFSIKWLTPFYPANPSQAAGGGEKCMDLRFLRLRRWLLKQQPNKTVFNRFIEN